MSAEGSDMKKHICPAAREVERRLKARLEARQDSLRAMGRTDINGLSAAWEMVEEIVEELEGEGVKA